MPSVALVSILCRDRVGLVSSVADFLFTAGVNLRDTTFAVYGAGRNSARSAKLPEGTGVAESNGDWPRCPSSRAPSAGRAFAFDRSPSGGQGHPPDRGQRRRPARP